MQKCKYCGRTMTEKALERHEPLCIANKGPNNEDSVIPDTLLDAVPNTDQAQQDLIQIEDQAENEDTDQQESDQEAPGQPEEEHEDESEEPEETEGEPKEDQAAAPPSFPAAMCPDTLVLKENNQMFFRVTGRRIGDVVYIEAVKMDR